MNDFNEDVVDTIDSTEMSFNIMPFQSPQGVIELLEDSVDDASQRIIDDSVDDANPITDDRQIPLTNRRETVETKKNTSPQIQENCNRNDERKPKKNFKCPICFKKLERYPVVSTKCGHVFCQRCLERSLLRVKKCPTCRCALNKASDYHPLYPTVGNPGPSRLPPEM